LSVSSLLSAALREALGGGGDPAARMLSPAC
jgi:hypothetical protein